MRWIWLVLFILAWVGAFTLALTLGECSGAVFFWVSGYAIGWLQWPFQHYWLGD